MSVPRPVFVLGIQRSGTTLAANLLAAHPLIAGVTAARHQGVHESVFFSHFARMFGPWDDPAARARALGSFGKSDYVALCGVGSVEWAGICAGAQGYADVFRALMKVPARRKGARAWVEKSPHHTVLADDIAAQMPDAVFLCVTRPTEDLLRSRLWSYGRVPPAYPKRALSILRACASNAFHRRYMARFAARMGPGRAFEVGFEDLRRDPDAALGPLLAVLGLPGLDGRRPEFARNTSFASDAARARALSGLDRALVRVFEGGIAVMPYGVLGLVRRGLVRRRPQGFPHWVWPKAGPQTKRDVS